jgi:GntR family transcriptional regulator, transcriptional repressor for pyruvate dehydrogenase complex
MFKHARPSRTFEDILFQIQETILDGRLKSGDRLPSERSLREIFHVSRGTLREAFRALEQKKLIEIRTGVTGGAFVRSVDTKQISESLDLLLRYQKVSLRELEEFRERVEPVIAAQAARKATREDVKELRLLLSAIETGLEAEEPDYDALIEMDAEFHLTLCRIAKNRVFESVLGTVYENIHRYFDQFLPRDIENLRVICKDLRKIVASIEERDPEKATSVVQRHIGKFASLMKKKKHKGNSDAREQFEVRSRRTEKGR